MGKKAGALLWNRRTLTFDPNPERPKTSYPVGIPVQIDTGLAQPNQGFEDYSPGEPALDAVGDIGSRIQVIPMAKPAAWPNIQHSDPYVGADGHVYVNFLDNDLSEFPIAVTINVLFWDPHSMVGPGDAAKYGGMPDVPQGPPPWE